MKTLIQIEVSLILFFLFLCLSAAIAGGLSYKRKGKPFYSGLFLGGFTGLLAGLLILGATISLWSIF